MFQARNHIFDVAKVRLDNISNACEVTEERDG